MKQRLLFTVLFSSILLTGCGGGGGGGSATTVVPANAVKVHVVASNFKWTLDKTQFKAGTPVDFIVSSEEGAHGFAVAGTKISQTVAQGDPPVNVVWTPTQSGTYNIMCNYFCGSGHGEMFTPITVTQ